VVQVQVRDFDVARRKRFRIDAEAVILRGDFNFPREEIFHRMIRAVVPEFQLESLAAESEAAELVSEAGAEDRDASEQLADIRDGVRDRLRIAGAIRQENTVRLQRENVRRGRL